MGRKIFKQIEYPCGTCDKDCEVGSPPAVFCGDCNLWYHAVCQQLTAEMMKSLENDVVQDYVCKNCAQQNGDFDYRSSLLRLFLARNETLDVLRSATTLEKIILRDDRLTGGSKEEVEIHGKRIDFVAQGILSRLGKNVPIIIIITIMTVELNYKIAIWLPP